MLIVSRCRSHSWPLSRSVVSLPGVALRLWAFGRHRGAAAANWPTILPTFQGVSCVLKISEIDLIEHQTQGRRVRDPEMGEELAPTMVAKGQIHPIEVVEGRRTASAEMRRAAPPAARAIRGEIHGETARTQDRKAEVATRYRGYTSGNRRELHDCAAQCAGQRHGCWPAWREHNEARRRRYANPARNQLGSNLTLISNEAL